ncbi:MAG: phosphoenolpyruvate synthase regulatory protein [Desulfuromonadales bacterium C00003068]|nr:kinase/pyrophosphorylase [Deltaproteobacteria bacterium]OEU72636.1 MAG: phosphoenolpyruvate synthase regulatory protein [Desulfuromonadales bacterium C00003068]
MNGPKVFLLSDATGETAENLVNAALTQFRGTDVQLNRISNVRTKNQVYEALDAAVKQRALVIYTMVNRELSRLVHDECEALGLTNFDIMTPLLIRCSEFLGATPNETPGLLHGVDEEYFRRIDAVEFTVRNDDGQETRFLNKADIVLVGVSRTSKTPLSIYLAHRGWKVANIPLVSGIDPPKELLSIDHKRVIGLVINPERLVELRASRLRNLGQDPRTAYADFEQVEAELKQAKAFFRKQKWSIINVTGKAVEETANEVLVKLKLK